MDTSSLANFTYCGRTTFLATNLGIVLALLNLLIRDILTMILEIVTYILLVFFLKRFIRKKVKVRNIKKSDNNDENGSDESNIDANKLRKINKKDMEAIVRNTKMASTMAALSILTHVLTFAISIVCIWTIIKGIKTPVIYTFLNILIICLKNFFTFFILFYFNLNFRSIANSFIGRGSAL
jgi:hypothetical protein